MSFDEDPRLERTEVDECTSEIKRLQGVMAETLEMVRCAKVNLTNLRHTAGPVLGAHPMLSVVAMQVDEAEKLLEDA